MGYENGHFSLSKAMEQLPEFAAEVDALENVEILRQKRERNGPEYPCPPELWIGPFADVAQIIGIRDWRVWLGVCAALSARASRNIHVAYNGPLFGMGYYLLVAGSSIGKSLCTRIFKKLLPSAYRVVGSVKSGQALPNVFAEITRDEKGKITDIQSVPAAICLNEWGLLLSNIAIHGSSLMQRLCEVHDAEDTFDIIRGDKGGKGNVSVKDPTLTILGTTTIDDFQKRVKSDHLEFGLINRHLILPGARLRWLYNSPNEFIDFGGLADYAERLPLAHTLGLGRPMSELYTRDAYVIDDEWGRSIMEPMHNAEYAATGEAIFKRLHVYGRRISLLYAWGMGATKVDTAHVQAAHAVVETSLKFTSQLLGDLAVDLPPSLKIQEGLEREILLAVQAQSGIGKDELCQRLKRHGGYTMVSRTVERLVQASALRRRTEGKKRVLHINL